MYASFARYTMLTYNNESEKVKVKWRVAKYGDPYSEFVLCI